MLTSGAQEILENLYKIYAPVVDGQQKYTLGDPIIINFSLGSEVEDGDISAARKFVLGLRKQLSISEAEIVQSNSKVTIKPKL